MEPRVKGSSPSMADVGVGGVDCGLVTVTSGDQSSKAWDLRVRFLACSVDSVLGV